MLTEENYVLLLNNNIKKEKSFYLGNKVINSNKIERDVAECIRKGKKSMGTLDAIV